MPIINIRRLRDERGRTPEDVAHLVRLDLSYFGQIERGKRNPTIAVLGRIADVLDEPLGALLEKPDA
jgi:transcriptional regulator with XRE-family HTH domain